LIKILDDYKRLATDHLILHYKIDILVYTIYSS